MQRHKPRDGLKLDNKNTPLFSLDLRENMIEIKNEKMLRRLEIYCLVFILTTAFWVRIKNVFTWTSTPEMFATYQGEPLAANFDSYYYLSLAKDLVEDTYEPIDRLRAYPEGSARPSPPPLLSCLAAALVKITPFSLNWIAAILPVFLAVLIVFPLYGLGRFYGGAIAGLSAALLGSLSLYYISRSNLGWFDTDSLVLVLTLSCCYFFLLFASCKSGMKYWFLSGGIISGLLLAWSWDSTRITATGISLASFLCAYLFLFKPTSKREGWILGLSLVALILLLLYWIGVDSVHNAFTHLAARFKYISKQTNNYFPNIGSIIKEQKKPSLQWIINSAAESIGPFIISIFGLCLIFYRNWRQGLVLAPLLVLASLTFFARRFALFASPVCALGVGVFLAEAWRLRNRSRILPILLSALTLFLLFPSFFTAARAVQWPLKSSFLIDAYHKISTFTPKNAVIWTMPENGYGINYWARRATISDGSVHDGEHTVYNSIPFAASNPRLAANYIQFFAVRGEEGMEKIYAAVKDDKAKGLHFIKDILSVGPSTARTILAKTAFVDDADAWLEFLYPSNPPPLYVFLNFRMLRSFHNIFKFGTWDVSKFDGDKSYSQLFLNIKSNGDELSSYYGIEANLSAGKIKDNNGDYLLTSARICTDDSLKTYNYDHDEDMYLDVYLPGNLAILQDKKSASTVLSNLFFFGHLEPVPHFEPVNRQLPSWQLYKVNADQLN